MIVFLFITLMAQVWGLEVSTGWQLCKGAQCYPAKSFPSTVLTNLIENNVFPGVTLENVYKDDQLANLPDIAVVGPDFYSYTFTNVVTGLKCDKSFALRFHGINFRSIVRMGGVKSGETAGMFVVSTFDVPADALVADNGAGQGLCSLSIEVDVSPPDFPGDASGGGQGGDHEIARNGAVTQFSAGWDWIQATPDRHTGIYDRVEVLEVNPALRLNDAHVRADVAAQEAVVDISANVATAGEVIVELHNADGDMVATASQSVAPGDDQTVTVGPLKVDNLHLWWPHTLGDPYLYTVKVFGTSSTTTTHRLEMEFQYGFRDVEAYVHPATEGWAFRVNGKELFVQGGNWITTDQLLRYANDAQRYRDELALHKDMGMNVVRVWGGGVAERDGFYQAADKLGLLVWQEFWMTGDNNGRWGGNYSFPDDDSIYLDNARSTIVRLRNHASLLMWCGGNELNPDGVNPKPTIRRGLENLLQTLDPTRFFIASSMAPQDPTGETWDPNFSFANTDGPYALLLPEDFYRSRNPGSDGYQDAPMSINPELGSVATPEVETMRMFLSEDALSPKSLPDRNSMVVHPLWDYHLYEGYTTSLATEGTAVGPHGIDHIYDLFGGSAPADIEEYCWRAGIVQYQQYKALFEGFSAHAWEWYAGVLFWKSQSPWPALRGGLYDYYLRQTGGFWGVRAALSEPLHLQLSEPGGDSMLIVNKSPEDEPKSTLDVRIRTFALDGTVSVDASANITVPVPSASVVEVPAIAKLWPASEHASVSFVMLELFRKGERVSRNVYHRGSDLSATRLSPCSLTVTSLGSASADHALHRRVSLTGDSEGSVCFMVRLNVVNAATGERILPVHYSTNYETITPGETVLVSMSFPHASGDDELELHIDGFNVPSIDVRI